MTTFVGRTVSNGQATRRAWVQVAVLIVLLAAALIWLGVIVTGPTGWGLGAMVLLVVALALAGGLSLTLRQTRTDEPSPGAHALTIDPSGICVTPGTLAYAWSDLARAWTETRDGQTRLMIRAATGGPDIEVVNLSAERIDAEHVNRAGALYGEGRWALEEGTP